MALSPKHARFVAEYLVDRNATAAYKRAGYVATGNGAEVNASKLLKTAAVQAAIDAGETKLQVRTGITQDRVLQELELLAFSDLTHYSVSDSGDVELVAGAPDGAMRGLQSIKRKIRTRGSGKDKEVTREVEIRLWDKPGPLKLAGQHVGLLIEKHAHTVQQMRPLVIDNVSTRAEMLAAVGAVLDADAGSDTDAGE
jgi:phage terminase small subunit